MWIGVPRRRSSTRECSSGVLFYSRSSLPVSRLGFLSLDLLAVAISPARFQSAANARENEIFCATRRLVQSAAERSREKPVDGRDKARHFHERAGDTDRAHGCYDEHEHHHPRGDRRRLRGACLHAAVRALPRRALSPLARVICLLVSFCTPISGLSRPALAGARLTSHPPRRTAARPEPFRDHAPRGRPRGA